MKTYREYKASDVIWTEPVPSHWKEYRIKNLGYLYGGLSGKKGEDFKAVNDGNCKLFIPFTNIANNEQIDILNLQYVTLANDEEQNQVQKGDLFFMMSSENFDDVGKSSVLLRDIGEVYLNSFCKGFRITNDEVNPFYLNFLLGSHSYRKRLMVEANGFTRINLKTGKVNDLKLFLPPLTEQIHIANYLDHKTAQIDKLISDKEKLIELLNEERTAIINQAVIKGIDPNVSMKDSGIDWLGQIPGHWDITRLKHNTIIRYGLGQPPKQKDGGLRIIRATNIFRGIIKEENMIYVDPEDIPWSRNPVLKEEDIIIVRSGAYTGDSAIITKEYEGSVTGYDIVVTPQTIQSKFLAYSLLSTYLLDNQLYLERLRAAQPHLNAEEIGNCFIITPPLSEQSEIAKFITEEHMRVDKIIDKTRQEVTLLREYKTALISEVVTGKVDVRNEIIPETGALSLAS